MKKALRISLLLSIFLPLFIFTNITQAQPAGPKAITQARQAALTPQDVLNALKQGNQRYMNNTMRMYNYAKEMKVTSSGQYPKAIILSCIDSRSIPDILFDQGLGNIFVARVAGNVADTNMLGSMDFATKLAGAKLIVVMGHTNCGAVRGACSNLKSSKNLNYLLKQIRPAVITVKKQEKSSFSCSNAQTIDAIAKQNVINQLNYILNNSPTIKQLIAKKQVELVGAMHDISTGKVTFFDINGNPV